MLDEGPPPARHAAMCGAWQCVRPVVPTTTNMKAPNVVLIEAAARLFADGHDRLAADVRQLARKWTPEEELVGQPQAIELPDLAVD